MRLLKKIEIVLRQTWEDFLYNCKHIKWSSQKDSEIQFSNLRMLGHMLDKGMNNIHFEKGHSMGVYIKACQLRDKLRIEYQNDHGYIWASQILERFEKAQNEGSPILQNQKMKKNTDLQIKEYTKFIMSRTSCRNFRREFIPSNVWDDIIKIAVDAPNSCCRQTVRYSITQNEEIINSCVPHIAGVTNFSNIQCLVCVASESKFYGLVDKHLQIIDAALSAENFILGASLYGVYGTMCNFFHASHEDIRICKNLFKIRESENIIMFIAMGFPTDIPEKPMRRNLNVFYKIID